MAKSLGGFAYLSDAEMHELLAHKKNMGFKDPRYDEMGI
jgi:hypothetical protein